MASLDRSFFSLSLSLSTRLISSAELDQCRFVPYLECYSSSLKRLPLQIPDCLRDPFSHKFPLTFPLLDLFRTLSDASPRKRKGLLSYCSANFSSSTDKGDTSSPTADSTLSVKGDRYEKGTWHEAEENGSGNGKLQTDYEAGAECGENTVHVAEYTVGEGGPQILETESKKAAADGISPSFDTGISLKEPIYEVLEIKPDGAVFIKSISRRQLLKSSGLRLRDIRSVDPSLWITNAAPALLVRDQAILLNLGSLRAIGTPENVLIFDRKSVGAAAFLELLLQRLNPESNPVVPTQPFELEVVESALLSRTQRLERSLMEIEPRVLSLLEVLPNRLTANVLEELRLSKQALVELGSKAGALRQMLLELLESPQEIRRITIMGRRCTIRKEDGSIECTVSSDKQLADDEEEEIEMLLENYLQRCESCHGQAERLLDSAKEMEDSIAVNLSSRRLEVSRLELLLQVGTFCSALGALIAGIFGMNLRSFLEANIFAFWVTTAGIILGGIVLFFIMYNHLKKRKIL